MENGRKANWRAEIEGTDGLIVSKKVCLSACVRACVSVRACVCVFCACVHWHFNERKKEKLAELNFSFWRPVFSENQEDIARKHGSLHASLYFSTTPGSQRKASRCDMSESYLYELVSDRTLATGKFSQNKSPPDPLARAEMAKFFDRL